jgi:hypothetical protein
MPSLIRLPRETSRTVRGPLFVKEDDRVVVVNYDYETDDGKIEWVRVRFDEVLLFEFRTHRGCGADRILSSEGVRSLQESELLSEILGPLDVPSVWEELEAKKGGPARFRHYTIFFDDSGCVDVIASSFSAELEKPR